MAWNHINAAQSTLIRGIVQQTDEGLLYVAPDYTSPSSLGALRMTGLALRRFELHNRTAAAAAVGIGFRWANRYWQAGQWDDSATGAEFIGDTTDAQDLPLLTADFPLETAAVANDGWVVYSTRKFNWVSMRVVTASVAGVGVARAARYSNFAGSGWTDFGTEADAFYNVAGATSLVGDVDFAANSEVILVFDPPADWGKVQASGLSGISGGVYALNIRATDAPDTTAAVASVIEIGTMTVVDALAANGTYGPEWSTISDPYADAVVAFFSVINAGNRTVAEVTTF